MRRNLQRIVWAGIAVAVGVGSGCRRPIEIPAGPVSYAAHLEQLMLDRCSGCHRPAKAEAGLVLVRGTSYEALVGPSSVQVPGLALVTAADLESSYLWHKVDDTASVGKGMPRSMTGYRRLPPDEIELIRRWIVDGALP